MAGLGSLPPDLRVLRPVRTLEATLARGRLPHGILLKGEDLASLESVATALAGALLETPAPLQHPDCFTLRPAKKSRSIAVGTRAAPEPNTIRGLIRDLNQSASQGGYKVAIIYEADRMNDQAANAFLKTLEEPPPRTVILLLTTRPYDLLETIRSRCFQFPIPHRMAAVADPHWEAWLADYRRWLQWLHRHPEEARAQPHKAILGAYGLVTRFTSRVEAGFAELWEQRHAAMAETLDEDELEALQVGLRKGIRDRLLIDIEEHTRLAAIELSHHVPFPALPLARAIAALEDATGLLALNMKDDVALESLLLQSLRIWTPAA